MLHLANPIECPPGGWKYFVKETGTWIPSSGQGFPHSGALMESLGRHCRGNHLPMPSYEAIQDQLCQSMPSGVCSDEAQQPARNYNDPCNTGWAMVKQGTTTLLSWLMNGFSKVDAAEAERRAGICVSCIENRLEEGCAACTGANTMAALVNRVTGGATTSRDKQLHACCICACGLKAKVWLPIDVILKNTPPAQLALFHSRAPHCWIAQAAPLTT